MIQGNKINNISISDVDFWTEAHTIVEQTYPTSLISTNKIKVRNRTNIPLGCDDILQLRGTHIIQIK